MLIGSCAAGEMKDWYGHAAKQSNFRLRLWTTMQRRSRDGNGWRRRRRRDRNRLQDRRPSGEGQLEGEGEAGEFNEENIGWSHELYHIL